MRQGLLFAIIIITNKNMLERINKIILFCFFILFTSFGNSFSDDKGLLKKPINEVLEEREHKKRLVGAYDHIKELPPSYFDIDHFKYRVGEEEPPYQEWSQ